MGQLIGEFFPKREPHHSLTGESAEHVGDDEHAEFLSALSGLVDKVLTAEFPRREPHLEHPLKEEEEEENEKKEEEVRPAKKKAE